MDISIKDTDNLRPSIILGYSIIVFVFIADANTPLGFAIWILYLLPVLITPHKTIKRNHFYRFAAVGTIFIWIGWHISPPGISPQIAVLNRIIMTAILWTVAYWQVQRAMDYIKLSESEEKYRYLSEILKENQLRFERAEALAHVGSWVSKKDTGTMELSEEMVRILGLDEGTREITIKEYLQIVHPDDHQRLADKYAVYHAENKVLDIEYRIVRPDGTIRYIHGISGPEFDRTGEAITRYGAAKDITERKLIELDLKETQSHLKEAQRLARTGSFTINYLENMKFEGSDELFRILGINPETGIPSLEEIFALVHPDDAKDVENTVQKVKNEGRKQEINFRLITPGGKLKHIYSLFNPVFDSSGKLTHLFGTTLDVTRNMRQQENLKKTMQKLEHSNKELEQFAYVASHDLQEPLRMVTSYLQLLERRYKTDLDENARDFIDFAVEGAKRMSTLIKDLLMYSRVTSQSKVFEEADLNALYKDVLNDLQVLIRETGAEILSAELPRLYCDPTQIRQLFQNLIGNAIKFHGENKPIVQINAVKEDEYWKFYVKDNGIGIDPQHYDRVFMIFQRLNEQGAYPGTGIGLAVCKKIVERHGGRIWLDSRPGEGTTFYFTLSATESPDSSNGGDDAAPISF